MHKLKNILYFAFIFIAIDTCFLSSLPNGSYFIKSFFLYYDSKNVLFNKLNILGLFCVFCVILFSYFIYSNFLFGITKKFRSLIVYRFKSRKYFIFKHLFKGAFYCLFITVVIVGIYLTLLFLYNVSIDSLDITFLILESVNLLLFFILFMCVNTFLIIRYSEVVAMCTVLSLSALIIIADIFVKPVSIIAYGDIGSQVLGIVIQVTTLVIFNLFIALKVKRINL